MTSAVVFAYHNVGVRCLSTLIAHGVDVRLVFTHDDNPNETIWFDSVKALAEQHGIETISPADPNTPESIEKIRGLAPDFIFSFYYRSMLCAPLLAIPRRGALNIHGSLLPKYRGRVPVNWAVIHGETETGATLHYMVEKPDAGNIVAQQSAPIGPDEKAFDVFVKITDTAAAILDDSLPALIHGDAPSTPQDLRQGSYFGGRKPEDGRIDWSNSSQEIHNLVRGVAPPYPGAFFTLRSKNVRLLRTKQSPERRMALGHPVDAGSPGIIIVNNDAAPMLNAVCGDGHLLQLLEVEVDGERVDANRFYALFGVHSHAQKIPFDPT